MAEKRIFYLAHKEARERAKCAISEAPDGYRVTISQPNRTLAQNDALWAALTDLSEQVDWYGKKLSAEEWKDVCTAALKKQKVVPGIDGGFVVIGAHTSKMGKTDLSELLDFIHAFGVDKGVDFDSNK